MSSSDTSQTTRIRILRGKALNLFHQLNPSASQGGRYTFSQSDLLSEKVGKLLGGCCSSPDPAPSESYTVTYYGNENTGGSAPVDSSSPYESGSSVTLLGNSGVLIKTGYSFSGWNTAADGTGTTYLPTNTFTIAANTALYAQWTPGEPVTYTVTYDGNTSTGGSVPVDGSSPYELGSTVTVLGNSGPLTKTGYTFAGWNTLADGTGTAYSPTDTFPIINDTTLYAQWTPITYTVTYNGNTNTGGSAPTDGSSPYIPDSTVEVRGRGTLTKTGYTFAGWNTLANGTGTAYSPDDTFSIGENTTLYAQWTSDTPTTFTVTYLGNTNTSGVAPVDGSSPYSGGTTVTILGNSGSPVLAKSGYQFAGWNTTADGTGTSYVGGNTFTIAADTTLYAQWIIGGARLVYNANTAAGGSGTAPPSSGTYYTPFSTQPVVGNTGSFSNSDPAKVFGGWNTAANGSGTSYPADSEYTMPGSGTVTLYAQWIDPATTYTLTYNAGTGGAGTAPASPTTYSANAAATILGNTGPFTNSDPNKIFYGWNTAADGSGTSYPAGSPITMNADKTLYAQWADNTSSYRVTYDANGATGGAVPAAPTDYPGGVKVSILGQGTLTKPGYTFLGWNGSATGAGSLYAPGYTFSSKTATLYALWAPGASVKNCGGGSAIGDHLSYIFPYAQIIKSTDTITIFTTALYDKAGTTNYGSGAAPEGLISITSKVVITSSTITINTNTSYSNSANDYDYSQTITNGVGVTYWPSGATISSVTFPTIAAMNSSGTNPPTFNVSTRLVSSGCGLTVSNTSVTGGGINVYTLFNFYAQGVTLNYSDSTNTQFVSCPTSSLYSANTLVLPIVWAATPTSTFPYNALTARSSAALTAMTIIPSSGSEYLSPAMPNYTVQYDGNGATSGTLPAPKYMSPYTATTSITIGTQGTLAKSTAPNTFSGWNTAADGSGTNYAASVTYTGGASLTLYAKWI